MSYRYKNSILGGTFDHLHIGHQKLLNEAFNSSDQVFIGIATKNLYKNKYLLHVIEDLKTRKQTLMSYLKKKSYAGRAAVIEIDDIYGNSLDEKNIDAIFVTKDTRKNAEKINTKRLENGLKPLAIVTVPFVTTHDGDTVSSDRIRRGEIDRLGNSYFSLFAKKKRFILPEELRPTLSKPIGKLFKNMKGIQNMMDSKNMLIAIGDVVVFSLLEFNLTPDISIFDYRTQRKNISKSDKDILEKLAGNIHKVNNAAGTIERRAAGAIRKAFLEFHKKSEKQSIVVIGEEDLLTIPSVLLAPLGSLIVYGQKDKGVIAFRVTEKKKSEVEKIFKLFS